MTDLCKRSHNELLLCPSQMSWWACWQHRAENRSRWESCDPLPNVALWKQCCWNPSMASKHWPCARILYFSRGGFAPRGPTEELLTLKSSFWWSWSFGSYRVCEQNTGCAQTGRRSGVTFHWPSRLPRNVAAHEMLKLNSLLLVSLEWNQQRSQQ